MSVPDKSESRGRDDVQQQAVFATDSKTYDQDLARGLAVSGEGKDYFAQGRIEALRKRVAKFDRTIAALLDFGCGDGSSTPLFHEALAVERVTGVDRSDELLSSARASHGAGADEFLKDLDLAATPEFDAAFSNGVFHHLALEEREEAARYVYERLRPGAWFALCENNPWNPGTRWVMSRIEFDRDAILISARRARALLASVGFQVLSTDYLFFFPRSLRWLRSMEPALRGVPLGAQYMVLARK